MGHRERGDRRAAPAQGTRAVAGELLDRGAERGFTDAQIGAFLGNEPARRAYIDLGFEVVAEKRDPSWEAAMGCPGTELPLRRCA